MPRHTHPRPVRKHDRAHVRHHRERVIAGRFSVRKNRAYGLDLSSVEIAWLDDEARDELVPVLVAAGAPVSLDAPLAYDRPHPELLRQVPLAVRRRVASALGRVSYAEPLGALTNRHNAISGLCCSGCANCNPYRYDPGYRARVAHRQDEEVAEALAHLDEDVLPSGRPHPRMQGPNYNGYCF